jgi:hypothetical protein
MDVRQTGSGPLGDHPRLRDAYLSTLTRLVHIGGNGILI